MKNTIEMIKILWIVMFVVTISYVTSHFTEENLIKGCIMVLIISFIRWFLLDMTPIEKPSPQINNKILQLLRYSFIENSTVLEYKYLTERERKIISEDEYRIILKQVLENTH